MQNTIGYSYSKWVLSGVGKRLGSTRANEDMEVDTSVMAGRVETEASDSEGER